MNLTKIMFAAGIALAATAAQADTLARYQGRLSSSDTLTVAITDQPADPSLCRAFEQPLQAEAYLTWTGVTQTTTHFAGGCWSTTSDGRISLAMRASSDGRPIDLILEPKDFVRDPAVPFTLWPTANQVTLERAPLQNQAAAPVILAYLRDKDPKSGVDGTVLLMEREVASCFGQRAREAAFLETPADGGPVKTTQGCWLSDGDQILFAARVPGKSEPMVLQFKTAEFTATPAFDRLAGAVTAAR